MTLLINTKNNNNLNVQLVMFRSKNTFKSSAEAANMMRGMAVEMAGESESRPDPSQAAFS